MPLPRRRPVDPRVLPSATLAATPSKRRAAASTARRRRLVVAALAILAAFTTLSPSRAGAAQQPERINVEELGRLPAFSHVTIAPAGELVFVSGTLGTAPGSLELVPGGVAAQTRQTLLNVQRILEAAGSSLGHVAKCSVFLADMDDFAAMNTVWLEFFGDAPPARTTTNSPRLALGAAVEIECIATRGASAPPPAEERR
ncbi:MAG: RidA family protein [Acidobacteria bacterium]|nr:MAG: RidA family protein [Acidobacteriota bacterium]REK07800.1 MAG: RidA family protein [Acidobacteriota bacterium]